MPPSLSHPSAPAKTQQVADITALLQRLGAGDPNAKEPLLQAIYTRLRTMAAGRLVYEQDNTLGITGLVHETYLRLDKTNRMTFHSRQHYYRAAARVMRRVLIDRARRRNAQRRGGGAPHVPLQECGLWAADAVDSDLINLDQALRRLEQLRPDLGKLVELKFFGERTTEQLAEWFEVSPRTIERRWQVARAWLAVELDH